MPLAGVQYSRLVLTRTQETGTEKWMGAELKPVGGVTNRYRSVTYRARSLRCLLILKLNGVLAEVGYVVGVDECDGDEKVVVCYFEVVFVDDGEGAVVCDVAVDHCADVGGGVVLEVEEVADGMVVVEAEVGGDENGGRVCVGKKRRKGLEGV